MNTIRRETVTLELLDDAGNVVERRKAVIVHDSVEAQAKELSMEHVRRLLGTSRPRDERTPPGSAQS